MNKKTLIETLTISQKIMSEAIHPSTPLKIIANYFEGSNALIAELNAEIRKPLERKQAKLKAKQDAIKLKE